MLIAIQDYYLYGALALAFLMLMGSVMLYMSIKNNAPDAFDHWKAKRNGDVICRVHFRGKQTVDYVATIDKNEKGMGTPYWNVPKVGLKFKPEADAIHFIEGSVPCCDYYENMPKSIKIETAVAFSQLKDYFKKIGIPIEGIEDLLFYVESESEISGSEAAIKDARINSAETKNILRKYITTINNYKEKLAKMQLESGVFIWQTAMNAIDSTIAYTSSSLIHTKETIRAAAKREEENKRKDLFLYMMIIAGLTISGVILLYGLKGLN